MRKFVCDSYLLSLNARTPENKGKFVCIGIVDSLLHPRGDLAGAFTIDRRENFIYSQEPDTTGHGEDILELLGYFAPESVFNLYRIVAENGHAKRGNLAAAIGDASKHGVDILNLSVGVYHREEKNNDCGGHCRIADEARLAIQNGTSVIAATGNRKNDDSRAVYCPALLDETIGVGGFVSRCTTDLFETEESGQYWMRNERLRGPFCGQRGCSPSHSCQDYRYELPWRGNVSFHNAEPDVLAPVHHPVGTEDEPVLQTATSFGTPVISGLLAAILGDLLDIGIDPDPDELEQAVSEGAVSIDESDLPKFHAGNTWDFLTEN